MGKNKRGPKRTTATSTQNNTSSSTSKTDANSQSSVPVDNSNAASSSSNCTNTVPDSVKLQQGSSKQSRSSVEARIAPFLKNLDHNAKLYADYTSLSGVVLEKGQSGNINTRSPVPIVGRNAAAEMVAKMEKTKPPPPNQSQPTSKTKENATKNTDEGLLNTLGPDSTSEQKLATLIQSANMALNKTKGFDLKKYEQKVSDAESETKKKLRQLTESAAASASAGVTSSKAVSHCEGGHEIVCRQCTEIQPPSLMQLIKYQSSSFEMFSMFNSKEELKALPSSNNNANENADRQASPSNASTSKEGSQASGAAENFLNLNPDNSKYSTELMLDSVLEYLQLERLNVARQFVMCGKQRKRLHLTTYKIRKRKAIKNPDPEPEGPENFSVSVNDDDDDSALENFDIHADLLKMTLQEDAKKPEVDNDRLKALNQKAIKMMCRKLYRSETCICKEAFFSKLGSEVTPCHPNRVKPCVCKLITSPKCSHCCSHEHAHDDHADSSEQSSDKREQLLSESSLQYLWYKMKTACKTFQRKSVGEILEDREFQLICKKWARDMCMEEYKNEEKRIRREKRERAKQWAVKKADIEAKIDKCLHVMEWARQNEEFMLDHATDDEREFLASVLIRGNGLIKSAKELSNDKQSIELIASPSMKPPVESSEIDKERVQMNTQRKFQLELPKLVELFEMKHILSYFSLW